MLFIKRGENQPRNRSKNHAHAMKIERHLIQLAMLGALLLAAIPAESQPVPVAIQKSGSQVTVSWPSGLSLVQPQKNTNVAGLSLIHI